MIDVRLFRNDLDNVRTALGRRCDPSALEALDRAVALDVRLREIVAERDELRARVNSISKDVGMLRRDGKADAAEALQAESRQLGETEKRLAGESDAVGDRLRNELLVIPNLPNEAAPDGAGDSDNPVVKGPFLPDSFPDHQRVPHWETATALGILDNERATKIAQSMFTMQRGAGATMARALCQLALDRNADAHEEIRPPSLVSTATLTATGQLPKFADDAFHCDKDDLYLIPTSEVPLVNLHGGETFDAADLPIRYCGYTPCFRREAGSYGRDTRGLIRMHQFNKVEMVWIADADSSVDALETIVGDAERILQGLELPYRVVTLSTGDLGFAAAKTYDLEVWLPSQETYREISSCSNCTDFQARRANIRYRPEGSNKSRYAHTLNGSGLAVGRTLVALLENHQQPDGTVRIPAALRPYVGGAEQISPR